MSRKEIQVSTKEAQRQRLIIEELKKIIQRKKEETGKNLHYRLDTFGCQLITTHEIFNPLTINGIRISDLAHF